MPAELQTRLLRVLADGEFYRVGGHQQIKANVRVIAATHQNLEERVREGSFREDLFHRLNVIRLRLPRCASAPRTFRCSRGISCRRARAARRRAQALSEAALEHFRGSTFPATCASSRTSATG